MYLFIIYWFNIILDCLFRILTKYINEFGNYNLSNMVNKKI
jgi:hypothetical protein